MGLHNDTGITADANRLMDQAGYTAATYLGVAVEKIDGIFGRGYSGKNPHLVAAFMQVAAADFATASVSKIIGQAIFNIAHAIDNVTPFGKTG